MCLILSIETATSVCSVALHQDGEAVAHTQLFVDRSHSEYLVPIIEDLLKNSNHYPKDLSAVAISGGPGSYTGLRIGTAAAKGFCYGLSVPLISIGTLEAMAYGMRSFVDADTLLCPVIDARRTAIYTLIADQEGHIRQAPHVAFLDNKQYRDRLPDQPLVFFGDGVLKSKSFLMEYKNIRFVEQVVPSALQIGCLAFSKFQQSICENIEAYTPWYLTQFGSQ